MSFLTGLLADIARGLIMKLVGFLGKIWKRDAAIGEEGKKVDKQVDGVEKYRAELRALRALKAATGRDGGPTDELDEKIAIAKKNLMDANNRLNSDLV